jgi:hypothetical protein
MQYTHFKTLSFSDHILLHFFYPAAHVSLLSSIHPALFTSNFMTSFERLETSREQEKQQECIRIGDILQNISKTSVNFRQSFRFDSFSKSIYMNNSILSSW